MTKATKDKKLRVVVSTNAMWAQSGYAQQAYDLLPRIRKEGYPLAAINFYGQEGGVFTLDDIVCYPKLADAWGSDALVDHSTDFKADVSFTLQDIWVLNPEHIKKVKRWIPILPIDHEPAPAAVVSRLKMAYRIVTYSKFGHDELNRLGYHSTYIPHTVDTNLFFKADREKIRKQMGIPTDYFMFGMVAANKDNPPRKSFQEVLDAFYRFHKLHPKSGIYFHSMLDQQGGFPIKEYAKFLGIQQAVYHLQPYEQFMKVKRDKMREIYSLMDCLLSPSNSEGFGVPIIEAQACETPVIVNDFTSMPELIIDKVTGYKTKVLYKRFTPLCSYVGIPSVDSIYEKMEAVYKTDRKKMGFEGRQNVIKNYDTNTVFKEKWVPFLAKLEDEIHTNPISATVKTS